MRGKEKGAAVAKEETERNNEVGKPPAVILSPQSALRLLSLPTQSFIPRIIPLTPTHPTHPSQLFISITLPPSPPAPHRPPFSTSSPSVENTGNFDPVPWHSPLPHRPDGIHVQHHRHYKQRW